MIGVEEYPIPHVQGHQTSGYRLLHEQQTSIVALMRGGEAMALGVNEAFPLAMFVHASRPDDIMLHHLQGQLTVVLVDSVVNSGKTVVQFVQHVRNLHATIRIVVITGVAQAQSVSGGVSSRHSPVTQNSVLLHFVSLTTSSLAEAPPTLATVYSTRRICPDCMSYQTFSLSLKRKSRFSPNNPLH
jgi:hypothetical protein